MAYRPPHLRATQASGQSQSQANRQANQGSNQNVSPSPWTASAMGGISSSRPGPVIPASGSSSGHGARVQHTAPAGRGSFYSGPSTSLQSPASDMKPMRRLNEVKLDKMEMLQSVSRSGGDGAEGDALKDFEVQDRFRRYIDERIGKHYTIFTTPRDTAPSSDRGEEIESLSSIVLLFRKLREGVVASSRIDDFAIEVFESSARLAILAKHTAQLMSSISGLVPGLYQAVDDRKGKGKARASAVDDIATSLEEIALDEGMATDQRVQFASILLLLQLVQSENPAAFHSTLTSLTSPIVVRLHPKLSSNSRSPERTGRGDRPLLSVPDLSFANQASRAISVERFDPLAYFALLRDERVSSYERTVLGWAEGRVRNRAWEMMKRAYISTGLDWANRLLGEEGEDWVSQRGTTCVDGLVKMR